LIHELSKHGTSFVHNGQIPQGSRERPCKEVERN
jgi:hypothetical protein